MDKLKLIGVYTLGDKTKKVTRKEWSWKVVEYYN